MGRALSNTMINLGIQGECDEAMYQVRSFDCIHRSVGVAKLAKCFAATAKMIEVLGSKDQR